PLLRARFVRGEEWDLLNVRPVSTSEIPQDHRAFVLSQARRYFERPRTPQPRRSDADFRYDMAILVDPEETDAPSDEAAIQKFVRAAATLGIEARLIEREDFARLAEFDALFIRETTRVNHHT